MATVQTARDRRQLVRSADLPLTSFLSILAGTLAALGAVALVLAAAGAVGSAAGMTTDGISTDEWRRAGIAGAALGTVVLLGAFFLGGYTAGRMANRAGVRHGLGVFVLTALLVGVVAALAALFGADGVQDELVDRGVPTDADTWSDIGVGAAIAAGVAIAVGSILGGAAGDRWHTRVTKAVVARQEAPRPRHALGDDVTMVDVRDQTLERERSLEEEREAQRQARADVGL